MAKSFDAGDAKKLSREHRKILARLYEAQDARESMEKEAVAASDAIVANEVMALLREVPVEELNREKSGIRVKALREAGYRTVADVAASRLGELTAVRGIGPDTARLIAKIVTVMVKRAGQGVKIRLSADDRNEASTRLVTAISKVLAIEPAAALCAAVLEKYGGKVEGLLECLAPATGGLRWFFTSSAKKKKAEAAYDALWLLLRKEGEYAREALPALNAFDDLRQRPQTDGWAQFEAKPVDFVKVLERIRPGLSGGDGQTGGQVYGLPESLAQELRDRELELDGLLCQLRRYQEWGVKYILRQEKVLLGDEMGLGKTVQAIAAMVALTNAGATHFIVVCPAGVLSNWCREIKKMSLLDVTKVYGGDREEALAQWLREGGVAVTTYETTAHFSLPDDFTCSMLVVDEAHYVKNPEAQRTANVKKLCGRAQRLLFMTGTALENRADEMVSIIGMLRPELAARLSGMTYLANAPQFREAVAPVYYRRKREDVLTELPDLIEREEWCALLPEEERLYEEAVLARNYTAARRVSWNVENPEDSSKAQRMLELIEAAREEGRKIIVFSFFLDTLKKALLLLGDRAMGPINGSVPPQRRQEIIDAFGEAEPGTALVAQIQSGGTGLNIQAASVVIICEPQFKPSTENQAISRAYRMGQTKKVLVHRLLCDDTVDERLTELLEGKQQIFDAFADESVAADESMEVDERSFGNIIEKEMERIMAKKAQQEGAAQAGDGTAPAATSESATRAAESAAGTPEDAKPDGAEPAAAAEQ